MENKTKKIGKLIDGLFEQRELKASFAKKTKDINQIMEDIANEIIELMQSEELTNAGGEKATATVKVVKHFNVADKEIFYKWAMRRKAYEFLSASVNKGAAKEMEEIENKLPAGINMFTKLELGLRKRS